jgi:hypothetical protein
MECREIGETTKLLTTRPLSATNASKETRQPIGGENV